MTNPDVIIIGGGLAGLCCARTLHQRKISCRILESAESVGGRVKTDEVEGFLLDRGFQVLLTAYPEARQVLDYEALKPRKFEPGALIFHEGRFRRLVDPWRRPRHLLATATSPVATLADKFRVARLRYDVAKLSLDQLLAEAETSTLKRLRERDFSDRIVQHFFRPFLGGVFLESELATSSRKFAFVFRMFSEGDAVLPSQGMQAIPRQIAAGLPEGAIRVNTPVAAVSGERVMLASGEELRTKAVVVATDEPTASKLLGDDGTTDSNGVTCVYFAAPKPPLTEPILVLNGDHKGPINNLCVPSQVAPAYAPDQQALISVTVLDNAEADEEPLIDSIRQQLAEWFGPDTSGWRHLRTYRIPHALPRQPSLDPPQRPVTRSDGVFVCGDYLEVASIQGAMVAGRRAAEEVAKVLSRR